MLIQKIKDNLLEARKAKDSAKVKLFSTILGELDRKSTGTKIDDSLVIKTITKLIESNQETIKNLTFNNGIGYTDFCSRLTILETENKVLEEFIPKDISRQEMEQCLQNQNIIPQIIDAKNDGQAFGIAIKAVKANFSGKIDNSVLQSIVNVVRHPPTYDTSGRDW